ncbi:hypothetical protein Ae717Ps2_5928c [Pseudonocardia sp. Ae717_Ps2]|uniref:hypothetical protein n=1 Tax=Pseudonocardia sp. Ae717_Ps2 TaxID=1885573 RepID=UPI000963D60E|nr:hypothetical protein [Pseudonocardia sp. Ae717_Ps2]OLM28959.1 hypothetical protein Ae717Ps2_5883c [Pseudonocardia sp. Ae717_Ps2]OLM29004.1 hypothetical protein Ae717Ps2_5928c [Pseudonocardia sp. Ae717_Ps2]
MTAPTTATATERAAAGPVSRARIAHTILRRVETQRAQFLTAYGRATTPIDRATAALAAVRAALPAAVTRPLAESTEIRRRLEQITDDLTDLLGELHTAQERAAETAIRAKQRTAARSQARREQRHAAATAAGGES